MFGTTDVYSIARTTDGKVYEVDYAFCAKPETYFYALDYSADNNFETSTTAQTKLELKASDVENLMMMKTPDKPLNQTFIGSVSYDSSTVNELKNRTRYGDDGQYYGLNTPYADSDKLNMSKYSTYFSGGYIFEFNFELSMNITNDGNQEFYLYNYATKDFATTAKKTRSQAKELGLLAEKLFNFKKGDLKTEKFTIRVPGNAVKNTMYTKFGANGDNEDKWIVSKVKCTTNVYKTDITEIYNKSGGKVIEGDGDYGLKCTSQADKIDLTKYKDYLNTDNEVILTFSFYMHEDNDGSQEIYLYHNNNKTSNGDTWTEAQSNGCLRNVGVANADGKDFDYNRTDGVDGTDTWIYFSVKVGGEQLSQNMYLRYDANGGGDNDWCLKRVNAYITIVEK